MSTPITIEITETVVDIELIELDAVEVTVTETPVEVETGPVVPWTAIEDRPTTGAVGLALLARSALTAGALLLGAGAGAPTELATTSYGRSFLGLADPAAGRSLLQLGASDSPTFAGLGIGVAPGAPLDVLMGTTGRTRFSTDGVNGTYLDFISADAATWNKVTARATQMSFLVAASGAPASGLVLTPSAPGTAGAGEVRVGGGQIDAAGSAVFGGQIRSGSSQSYTAGLWIKQTGDVFGAGIALQRAGTLDTWAIANGADSALYLGAATNASGADAEGDFGLRLRIAQGGQITIYGDACATAAANQVNIGNGQINAAGTISCASGDAAYGGLTITGLYAGIHLNSSASGSDVSIKFTKSGQAWAVGAGVGETSNNFVWYDITGGAKRMHLTPAGDLVSVGVVQSYDQFRVYLFKTPSSASDTGTVGSMCYDANYIYVCVATNTWKRVAIATW